MVVASVLSCNESPTICMSIISKYVVPSCELAFLAFVLLGPLSAVYWDCIPLMVEAAKINKQNVIATSFILEYTSCARPELHGA